jgi:Zn-dependent metalloprotease
VIGDLLKVQSQASSGTYLAVDLNRPGQDTTYNMKGSFSRTNAVLSGSALTTNDIASDADNKWTDGAVVSAQVYAGYTYDYYKQVFNRSGLDGKNIKIRCLVNPARPQDAASPPIPIGSDDRYYNNAVYFGNGYIVFGVGTSSGSQIILRNFGGALDIVAHELTHGVTEFTSNLNCCDEAGALNESFSDMMSVAVEFRFQKLGTGLGKSDWLEGEDVFPNGGVIRSLINPHSVLGTNGPDPDHYSLKQTGFPFTEANDFGWVHANSNIVSHMYYLAIMGGVNRVSGLAVQGVGFANRQLIERAIFRAFTLLMPSNATFSICRGLTIQAARDLYGNNSPAETALTQAWNAVGVH